MRAATVAAQPLPDVPILLRATLTLLRVVTTVHASSSMRAGTAAAQPLPDVPTPLHATSTRQPVAMTAHASSLTTATTVRRQPAPMSTNHSMTATSPLVLFGVEAQVHGM
jgi:hypothetical protein